MTRILLVQTSYLGDVILSTPVVAAIKEYYPKSSLTIMTTPEAAPLLKRDPLLEEILVFDKRNQHARLRGMCEIIRSIRERNFDIVFSLHKSYRTALVLYLSKIPVRIGFKNAKLSFLYTMLCSRKPELHDVLRNLSILENHLALSEVSTDLRLFPPQKEQVENQLVERIESMGDYAVIAPGSAWKTKRWPAKGFRQACKHLLNKGLSVAVVGSQSEYALGEQVCEGIDAQNLTGGTSIEELLYLVSNARIVICNDSMTLHLTSALKIPCIVLFCATSPSFGFGPWRNKAIIVEKEGLSCKPCCRHGSPVCPTGTEACMLGLEEPTIRAVDKLLGNGDR